MLTDPNRPKPPVWRIILYCAAILALLWVLGVVSTHGLPQ